MEETIVAIATPMGMGSVSVVRLSGKTALRVADAFFEGSAVRVPDLPTHTLHHGFAHDAGQRVDEVMLAVMKAPRSYTAEDVVEISCHGGLLPARLVLELALQHGARLAQPGEFTRRAFLNGRVDLTQAEAVLDVVSSQTRAAHAAAMSQLGGRLSIHLQEIYNHLADTVAHVEAHIDFPEEDIAPQARADLLERIEAATARESALVATARDGRVLREGVRTAIVGMPNVGKSSLLNALLGQDRAIVSPEPGTTRDTNEEMIAIEGIPLRLVDTAGLRHVAGAVEQEGMARTRRCLETAELVLLVLDSSRRLEPMDRELLALCKERPLIVVLNKTDLGQVVDASYLRNMTCCSLSMKTGEGLDGLRSTIAVHLWQGRVHGFDHEIFINARHQEALMRSVESLRKAAEAMRDGKSLEFVAADLREALRLLGEVNGRTFTEDILDRIFSSFCIGK